MFHALVSESKDRSDTSRTTAAPQVQRKLHPRFQNVQDHAGAQPAPAWVRQLQSSIGNRAMLHSISPTSPRIQTKLTVNQPGDRYEQEADQIADRVMRMSIP